MPASLAAVEGCDDAARRWPRRNGLVVEAAFGEPVSAELGQFGRVTGWMLIRDPHRTLRAAVDRVSVALHSPLDAGASRADP